MSDAIFYMLSKSHIQYTPWYVYEKYYDNALGDINFPNYLVRNLSKIEKYHLLSPILAPHSNEYKTIQIIRKLIDVCDLKNKEKHVNGDESTPMEIVETGLENQILNSYATYTLTKFIALFDAANNELEIAKIVSDQNRFSLTMEELLNRITYSKSLLSGLLKYFLNTPVKYFDSVTVLESKIKLLFQTLDVSDFNEFQTIVDHFNQILSVHAKQKAKFSLKYVYSELEQCSREREKILLTSNEKQTDPTFVTGTHAINEINIVAKYISFKVDVSMIASNTNSFMKMYARYYVVTQSLIKLDTEINVDELITHESLFFGRLAMYVNCYTTGIKNQAKDYIELQGFTDRIVKMSGTNTIQACEDVVKHLITLSESKSLSSLISQIDNFTMYTEKRTLNDTILTLDAIIMMFETVQNPLPLLTHVLEYLKELLTICQVSSLESVYTGLRSVKQLYVTKLDNESFEITKLASDIEGFIDSNETTPYNILPGETNRDKLDQLYTDLIKPLLEIYPTLITTTTTNYEELLNFLNNILETQKEDFVNIDGTLLNTVWDRLKELDIMKIKNVTLAGNLSKSESVNLSNAELVAQCERELETSRELAAKRVEELTALQSENNKLISSLKAKEKELIKVKKYYETLQTSEREKDERLSKLDDQIVTLKDDLKVKDDELDKSNREVQSMQKLLDVKDETLATLQIELSTLTDNMKSKVKQLVESEYLIKTMQKSIDEKTDKLEQLNSEFTSLTMNLEQKERELLEANQTLNEERGKTEKTEKEFSLLRVDYDKKLERLAYLTNELEQKEEQLLEANQNLNKEQIKVEKTEEELRLLRIQFETELEINKDLDKKYKQLKEATSFHSLSKHLQEKRGHEEVGSDEEEGISSTTSKFPKESSESNGGGE